MLFRSFNGTNATIDITNSTLNTALGGQSNFTIAFWFNTTDSGTNAIIDIDRGSGGDYMTIGITSGSLFFTVRITSIVIDFTTDATYNDGTWYHAVFQCGTGGNKVFINGTQNSTLTYTNGSPASTDKIPVVASIEVGSTISATNYYNGYLDNFFFSTHLYTSGEVSTLAATKIGRAHV